MKKKSKIIAIILVVAIMLIDYRVEYIASANEQLMAYCDAESATAGEEVSIPVKIKNNPGVMGFAFNFDYNSDAIEPVEVTAGSVASKGVIDSNIGIKEGKFQVSWAADENIYGDGTLFVLKLKISEYAFGVQKINFSIIGRDTFDENLEDVLIECQDISIDIKQPVYNEAIIHSNTNMQVNSGNDIDIPLFIKNNNMPGISVDIDFDTEVFTYKSISFNGSATGKAEKKEDGITVWLSGIKGIDKDAPAAIITLSTMDYVGGNYRFVMSSEDINTGNFNVTINNTHSDEGVIIYGGDSTIENGLISVPVCIKNNSGIMGYKMKVEYDKGVVTPKKVTVNPEFSGSTGDNIGLKDGYFNVMWAGTDNVCKNTWLYNVSFVAGSSESKNTEIKVSVIPKDTFDKDLNEVEMTVEKIVINTKGEVIPTSSPTKTPSAVPTATPVIQTATPSPTIKPTATPTVKPTATPTVKPTATPTVKPTAVPTATPTQTPVITDPDKAVIAVQNKTAFYGTTAEVEISLSNNPGILGAALNVEYDPALELVKAETGEAFNPLVMTESGSLASPCRFVWDGQTISENDIKDGVILKLSFKLPEKRVNENDEYYINISGEKSEFVNAGLTPVDVVFQSGKLKIKEFKCGDMNNDGTINTTDIILLRRYVAGDYGVSIADVKVADINGDGEINTTDIILIRRYVAGGYGINSLPYKNES